MKNLCYCPVCQKEMEFVVTYKKTSYNEGDICFDYIEKIANCKKCGEELFVEEINEENQHIFEENYRKASNIITNDEIKEIIDKYRITKRNLPLVLGLGEQTITRYLDEGYIPSKKISDLLKELLNDPELYFDYLKKNKDNVKESVYKKSKNQVDALLNINDNDQLIEDVAEYIIIHNEQTTNLVLQKLLYYVEVFYMLFKGRKLFKSVCRAWEYGPVYGRIYYEFKEFGHEPIDKDFEEKNIDSELKKLIDEVIKNFGIYSGKVLSSFTHTELPWKNTQEKGIIEESLIRELANSIKEELYVSDINEIYKYSNKKISEYNSSI